MEKSQLASDSVTNADGNIYKYGPSVFRAYPGIGGCIVAWMNRVKEFGHVQ